MSRGPRNRTRKSSADARRPEQPTAQMIRCKNCFEWERRQRPGRCDRYPSPWLSFHCHWVRLSTGFLADLLTNKSKRRPDWAKWANRIQKLSPKPKPNLTKSSAWLISARLNAVALFSLNELWMSYSFKVLMGSIWKIPKQPLQAEISVNKSIINCFRFDR